MGEFTYSDLIDWAKDRLPKWQQDALRRLLEKPKLSTEDVADLAAMALAPHADHSKAPSPEPPVSTDQLQPPAHPCVRLTAIRDVHRVNALSVGPITFAPDGITAIFGMNASGKSGVTRILKKACHSRDPGGPVLPNVFQQDPQKPAAATIDLIADGVPQSFNWVERGERNSLLHTINVFDSACAAIQVEEPNRISYTPAILQVFRSLASTIDSVASELRRQRVSLGARPESLTTLSLDADTEAGQFLANLNATSQLEDLQRLCELTVTEKGRILELDRALADDPLRRAQAEDARSRLIQDLAAAISSAADIVGDDNESSFLGLIRTRTTTKEAAEAARAAFSGASALSGIGSDAWRALWESARTYSENSAYTAESFPVLREGSLCVLCQQDLSPVARTRLRSFEEFVKADVQQQADCAAAALQEAVFLIRDLSLPRSVRRNVREAGILETAEGEAARRFLVTAKLRRRQLLKIASSRPAGARIGLPRPPDLSSVLASIRSEANRLRLALHATERNQMERERAELKARATLSPHKATLREEIERSRRSAEFQHALDDCKTQAITLKRREASEAVLTDRLRSDFQANLLSLGFSESPVEVKLGAGDHGEHPVQIKLIARPDVPPEEILSEGERTCVALSGLLAELNTTGNRSALVLDDPISSLDHQYRKRVAERLIREAKGRQVVVFTHDVVFLYLLRKYQAELDVPMTELELQRGYKGNHGRARVGPPWVAMSVRDRLKCLREEVLAARRLLKDGGSRSEYDRRASEIYKRLRMCWERAIEEVLLNNTVVRFGDSVQTKRLEKLTDIGDTDIERVTREMSRCSDFEHDESGAVYAELPGPDIIEGDIKTLGDWIIELRTKRGRS